MRMSKAHHKLTAVEREQIAIFVHQNMKKREIARRLGRSDSTIREELRRNRFGEYYVAVHAQAKAEKRVVSARHRHPLKNKSIYKYVMKKLRCGWSPEQIAGRLKLQHPDNAYWHIHHETIYRFIYAQDNKDKRLWEYLPRKQKKRKHKYGRTCHRSRIPDRVSIHDRPEAVETRLEFGHWEGDSIEGKGHRGGIHTEVERKSRFIMAALIPTLTATDTKHAARSLFAVLPPLAKKSTTLDNGKEFMQHSEFGLSTYFADSYASWQRGTNENSNGLIRRYLPKKTDFSTIDQSELTAIIEEINNRPRKCLGYQTAREVFEKELVASGARIPTRM